jgi:hypothetical protein
VPIPVVASVEFAAPQDPASGEARLRVSLADGRVSEFDAATFDRAAAWLGKKNAAWRPPVLFVARLDAPSVRAAVDAMAAEMGGYWLRYYHSR